MSPTPGSQPEGLALGGGAPRAFGFECRSAGAPWEWEKQTPLLEESHKVSCTLGPETKQLTS